VVYHKVASVFVVRQCIHGPMMYVRTGWCICGVSQETVVYCKAASAFVVGWCIHGLMVYARTGRCICGVSLYSWARGVLTSLCNGYALQERVVQSSVVYSWAHGCAYLLVYS
jgi:hypothetical protein